MRTALSILAAIAVTASAFGQTQTFHQVTVFGTNVYLGDNLTTPLRDRVPSGAVISGASSTNSGTAGVQVIGSNLWFDVYNWSAVAPTQNVGMSGYGISSLSGSGAWSLSGTGTTAYGFVDSTGYLGFSNAVNGVQFRGRVGYGGKVYIHENGYGHEIAGYVGGTARIGSGSGSSLAGSRIIGYVDGTADITYDNIGSLISGYIGGRAYIGQNAYGSIIHLNSIGTSSATNLGSASMIIADLQNGEHSYNADTADGSLTIGKGTNTHSHALLVSDDSDGTSKGNGTMFASGGDYSDNYGSIANATGTPAHMTDTAGLHTNYLRHTSSTITDSSDAGAPHQFTHSSINGTNYLAVFSQKSNEWYFIRMQTSTELGF